MIGSGSPDVYESVGGGADKTAMLTAREVGKLEGLKFLFELEADE